MLEDLLLVVLCSDHLKGGLCLAYVLENPPVVYQENYFIKGGNAT